LHLFALIVFSMSCQAMEDEIGTTSFFVTPIYKIEEKVGVLESRLAEIEDIERHLLNKLDQAAADEKKTIRAADRQKIVDVKKWLKNKVALISKDKKQILNAMKKLLIVLPAQERLSVLRRLKIEYRFNSVKEMIQDATAASGFTEQQLKEFHKQQLERSRIDKQTAEARRKLAQAELEKLEAQKKAKEAVKLAKAKSAEVKAIKEVKQEIKEAKKLEKKSNKVLNKLIDTAKKESKKQELKTEKLEAKVKELKGKTLDAAGKAKLEATTKALNAAKALNVADHEKVKKLITDKYDKKIETEQAAIKRIEGDLNKTTGVNKQNLEKEILNIKTKILNLQKEKAAELAKIKA